MLCVFLNFEPPHYHFVLDKTVCFLCTTEIPRNLSILIILNISFVRRVGKCRVGQGLQEFWCSCRSVQFSFPAPSLDFCPSFPGTIAALSASRVMEWNISLLAITISRTKRVAGWELFSRTSPLACEQAQLSRPPAAAIVCQVLLALLPLLNRARLIRSLG